MIGRRTTVGLSLLCALLFSAIAVQSASAKESENTTAVTCVEGGGNLDFKDAHCDETGTPGKEKFGHSEIKAGSPTEVTIDNTTTGGTKSPAVLKSKAAGAAVEISCNTVHGEGTLENVNGGSVHKVKGSITVKYGVEKSSPPDCTVIKPTKCIVKEPIEVKATAVGVDGLGPEKNTMGVEFKPAVGTTFVSIEFKNKGAEACSLNAKTFPVEGNAIMTGKVNPSARETGATAVFTDEMTTETLKFGPEKAGFDSIGTVKMTGAVQNPVALTTTT